MNSLPINKIPESVGYEVGGFPYMSGSPPEPSSIFTKPLKWAYTFVYISIVHRKFHEKSVMCVCVRECVENQNTDWVTSI